MLRALFLALLALFLLSARAQDPNEADHAKLRKLKDDLTSAVSRRDFHSAQRLLHEPFMATVITQASFSDVPGMKRYFDAVFTTATPRLKDVTITADADELSRIMTGTFAFTRGTTSERYALADGRTFDMKGRWTAVSIKEPDGSWKVLSVHSGVNFLDNPVMSAVEQSAIWTGAGSLVLGAVVGWLLHALIARRRRAA